MSFFRRFVVGLIVSLFSFLLIVFAVSISVFFVLDKPDTLKGALRSSGLYSSFVDAAIADQQASLGETLVIENSQLQTILKQSFTPQYLQAASEKNIDSTYDWVHGKIKEPDYSVDTSQPRAAFAQKAEELAAARLSALPVCPQGTAIPPTPAAVLDMTCRPAGIPVASVAEIVRLQAENSYVIQDMAQSTAAIKDDQGQTLADRLSMVPKIHRYFIWSLFLMPLVLLLCGVGLRFWSLSPQQGLKHIGRILLGTGIVTILLAVGTAWLLGQGAQWFSDSNQTLVAVQGKLLEAGHIMGNALRNWLVGVGAGYIVLGVGMLVVVKIKNRQDTNQNKDLNSSLGYSPDIPTAGTTFDPAKENKHTEGPADPDLKLK